MANPQAHLQSLTDTYQSLQVTLSDTISARQKLASQQQENRAVQKEFSTLDDDDESAIYKLVGPVLLKQEKAEAVLAVEGRLTYIDKEIERAEKTIGEIREKSEGLKMEVSLYERWVWHEEC
jgi:prefoldin beta subunit